MKFNYNNNSKSPGIYKILNVHTNRIYIGQCKSFQQRWHDHKRHLLDGRHQNKFLLNDFKKCREELGHDDFLEFHVLEVMENSTKEQRNQREELYIASVFDRQDLCYNFKQKIPDKERSCYSKTPEETSKLISDNSKQLWQCSEHREFMKSVAKKTWLIADENKKQKMLSNLNHEPSQKTVELSSRKMKEKWQNDVGYKNKMIENGKIQSIKNKQNNFQPRAKLYYGFILAPNGVKHEVYKLKEFCNLHNLNQNQLRRIFNKQRKTYKGWKLT